jgi:uncharacterized protein (TIGR03435 family)
MAQTTPAAATDWQTAAGGKMEFELISVRENKSPVGPGNYPNSNIPWGSSPSYLPNGGHFLARSMPLEEVIGFAYKLTGQEIRFQLDPILPGWVISTRYDIEAQAAEGKEPTKDQMRLMVQSLLADRFKLKIRTETKEGMVYALHMVQAGTLGPTLKVHPADVPCTKTWTRYDPNAPKVEAPMDGLPDICGSINLKHDKPGVLFYSARGAPMLELAKVATLWFNDGRPVLEQTGLQGTYDLKLEFAPSVDPAPSPAGPAPPGWLDQRGVYGSELTTALKKQLGLQLDKTKGPVQTLVLEHIERPSEN